MKRLLVLLLSLVIVGSASAGNADDLAPAVTGEDLNNLSAANPDQCCTLRGDFNSSGSVTMSDATALWSYAYNYGAPPPCMENIDADGNGKFNICDVFIIMTYLFAGGALPVPC